mgnify:CR=1|jgi:hypothetical protein
MVCIRRGLYGVVRVPFVPKCLPTSPDSYALTEQDDLYVPLGESRRDAQAEAGKLNDVILTTARVPSVWHLAVRDLRIKPTDY